MYRVISTYIYTHICTYIYTHTYIYIYVYIHVYTFYVQEKSLYIYVYAYIYTITCTHIYIYMYIFYIYVCMRTCVYTERCNRTAPSQGAPNVEQLPSWPSYERRTRAYPLARASQSKRRDSTSSPRPDSLQVSIGPPVYFM